MEHLGKFPKRKCAMNERTILDLHRLPARLDVRQTALLLGFQEHEIPILIREKLLKPLGRPAPNATKYFAASDITSLSNDPQFLARCTTAVYTYHHARNHGQNLAKK